MRKSEIIYCTYFDKGFLLKGLALHSSLISYNPDAKLWILAFDKYTESILKKIKLKGVTVIPLADFEDKELLQVKKNRTPVEYYWTCTPSWIFYVMNKNLEAKFITYLDADLYFFSNPDISIDEIGEKSLLIVGHRFPRGKEGMAINGKFNVAFNVFKNNRIGKACLEKWRAQCLEWCFAKPEGGKLGDQTYLDEWPDLYSKDLVISKNVGIDAAPWNISQYQVTDRDGKVFISGSRLVCYHFHQFQILNPSRFSRTYGFIISKNIGDSIYKPYEKEIMGEYKRVKSADPSFEIEQVPQYSPQILRQKMAKYFGPVYWKLKKLVYTLR